jgi:hypothetical protein
MLLGTMAFVASVGSLAYDHPMAKAHKFDLENPAPILDDEDEETLAAIDEGVRDAEAGRVVSGERVRENWLAIALEMQQNARANLAIERKRLREILAQREGSEPTPQTSKSPTLSQHTRKNGAPS